MGKLGEEEATDAVADATSKSSEAKITLSEDIRKEGISKSATTDNNLQLQEKAKIEAETNKKLEDKISAENATVATENTKIAELEAKKEAIKAAQSNTTDEGAKAEAALVAKRAQLQTQLEKEQDAKDDATADKKDDSNMESLDAKAVEDKKEEEEKLQQEVSDATRRENADKIREDQLLATKDKEEGTLKNALVQAKAAAQNVTEAAKLVKVKQARLEEIKANLTRVQ